ncbi:related to transcriptional regulator [Desulfotalea psychrophila LSv54]|uniref:Related to transcriptional regulator n=2 Tax=Desulfotalea psychrophila TaxID=84980 RepID=Q6ALY0_DESPS|nr:related to transcriptional regulator [Desulfotalea psychrophila LSv54]
MVIMMSSGIDGLSSVKSEKSTDKIIRQIRRGILKGDLQPGTFLGSEKDLSELFEVSKQTLRETINALEYMGLVTRKKGPGGGVYICRVSEKMAHDLLFNFFCFQQLSPEHLSEMRIALEPLAARAAAENITAELLARLKGLNMASEKAFKKGDFNEVDDYAVLFHKEIGKASGNPLIAFTLSFVEDLLSQIKAIINVDREFAGNVIMAHKKIYRAMKAGDPAGAAIAMLEDVEDVGAGLLRLSRKAALVPINDNGEDPSVFSYLASALQKE